MNPVTSRAVVLLSLVLCALSYGCSDPDDPESNSESDAVSGVNNDTHDTGIETDTNAPPDATPDATDPGPQVTYHQDIRPLLEQHCTECHVPDAIAPFALQTFEDAAPLAPLLAASVRERLMPPWTPSEECSDIKHARRLTDEEIDLFVEWAQTGALEGDPDQATPYDRPARVELGAPDYVVDPGYDYKPVPVGGDGVDDYRCMIIDPELTEAKFLNGVDTVPGNPAIVHHMILYSVPASATSRLAELEAEDDRPGYTCFGGPRINDVRMLAGWVPGSVPLQFAETHGIRIEAGSKYVMQVHYNTINDPEGTDRTTINFHYNKNEDPTELVIVPLGQYTLDIPAGDSNAVATASSPTLPVSVKLHGIAPHMHMLGKSIRVTANRQNDEICLIDVPDWNFDWQGFYLFEETITVPALWTSTLTCTYDNSPENQPYGREPRDVTWGDGTFDEMCLVYFIIEMPEGI